jgi:hypothetical protein
VTGDDNSATAVIIRADDPDFEFKVTRDAAWAKAMGLDSKENYRKQRGTMLQWRAISAVARLACPEALYGVAYTPDEMGDMPSTPSGGGLGAVLAQTSGAEDAPGRETVAPSDQGSTPGERPDSSASESPLLNTGSKLAKAMYAAIRVAGITKDETPGLYRQVTGRDVESSKELTDDEARAVLAHLDAMNQPLDAELVDEPAGDAS